MMDIKEGVIVQGSLGWFCVRFIFISLSYILAELPNYISLRQLPSRGERIKIYTGTTQR